MWIKTCKRYLIAMMLVGLSFSESRDEEERDSEDWEDKPDEGPGDRPGGGAIELCTAYGGPPVRLWTLEDVKRNSTHCNIVFYDRVYHMDEFIPIHKGGAWAIERNCGEDATWQFERLQCIPSVPDHFEGMLNMCNDYIVGAIKGSPEDPCATDNWSPPVHEYPDFVSCDVYDNITCADLARLPNNGPNKGKWTPEMVAAAQKPYPVDWNSNTVEHCYTILYNWVFDLGVSPLDGTKAFYLKHGNGEYPEAVLKHCGGDMTKAFSTTVDQDRLCVPDHTLGGMNVLSGYVVGVLEGSEVDPCENPPPDPCKAHIDAGLSFYTMQDIRYNTPRGGCVTVVLDKVYDLVEFAPHHYGGAGEIFEKCGRDMTGDFFEKRFHNPLFHLGSIQKFQIGVIMNGVTDPCGSNYDATLDF